MHSQFSHPASRYLVWSWWLTIHAWSAIASLTIVSGAEVYRPTPNPPTDGRIGTNNLDKFKLYVQEIIRTHRTDKRVSFWEIHNEPPPGDKYRDRLKKAGYTWAKEVGPIHPVLNCEKGRMGWGDCEVSDIVDAHVYSHAHGPLRDLSDINPTKGTVFTEAGARWKASRRNFGGPVEMIYWLQQRRQEVPVCSSE